MPISPGFTCLGSPLDAGALMDQTADTGLDVTPCHSATRRMAQCGPWGQSLYACSTCSALGQGLVPGIRVGMSAPSPSCWCSSPHLLPGKALSFRADLSIKSFGIGLHPKSCSCGARPAPSTELSGETGPGASSSGAEPSLRDVLTVLLCSHQC